MPVPVPMAALGVRRRLLAVPVPVLALGLLAVPVAVLALGLLAVPVAVPVLAALLLAVVVALAGLATVRVPVVVVADLVARLLLLAAAAPVRVPVPANGWASVGARRYSNARARCQAWKIKMPNEEPHGAVRGERGCCIRYTIRSTLCANIPCANDSQARAPSCQGGGAELKKPRSRFEEQLPGLPSSPVGVVVAEDLHEDEVDYEAEAGNDGHDLPVHLLRRAV